MRRVGVPAEEAALHVQTLGPAVRRCRNFSRRFRDAKPRPEQQPIQKFVFAVLSLTNAVFGKTFPAAGATKGCAL